MWIATAALPATLDADLVAGNFAAIAALKQTDAPTAFARGIALSNLGRARDARAAFEAAAADPALANAATVEMGFTGLTTPDGIAAVVTGMTALMPRLAGVLAARASHLLGTAQFRQMHVGEALDALTAAQKAYRTAMSDRGEAQVLDTLGMVHQYMGNETAALVSYAHSLALKAQIGDRFGMAITLGNLGRYAGALGRSEDARGFLGRDFQLAKELGDARGQARVLIDLAELERADGALGVARDQLGRAHDMAVAAGQTQLEFETLLELAITETAAGDTARAKALLEDARQHAGVQPSDFDRLVLGWAESGLTEDRTRALTLLGDTVAGFRDADMPALEIEARLARAALLLKDAKKGDAEGEVLLALKRSRERNLPRYRVRIGELMERLDLAEGVAEESGKAIGDTPSGTVDGYILRPPPLGTGTFAVVHRAFDVERAREVALKVFDLESRYANVERSRLLDSARLDMEAANRAKHPGLVKVYAMGRDQRGNVYLAIELIAGKDLRERLDTRPARDPKMACATLADVAEALAALHAQGVVHRDLKPENIMLRADGSPVIVDFGIAHIKGVAQQKGSVSRGSPEYFSPEQERGEPPASSDDMFSFGIILWEWVHGLRPNKSFGPPHASSWFGGHAALKSVDELAGALTDPKGANRPDAQETARLLRAFAQ